MTVIAWDGRTLAADRRLNDHGHGHTVTKIRRAPDGALVASCGAYGRGLLLMNWYCGGADPNSFPGCSTPDGKHGAELLVVRPDGALWLYDDVAVPLQLHDKQYACGSGREYAYGAMAMGASAVTAVEIASRWEANCGGGVDVLELKP